METTTNSPVSKKWMAPFFTIWTGQAFSLLGSQLVQFALIWWLTKTTGSATVLATASLVGLVPQVVLGPIAGTLVDRWSRRVTMIVADTIIALATLGLALLFLAGSARPEYIYVLMFIRSLAGGFHYPAMTASTSLMVPKEHLARVQGANQMLGGLLNIFSAPLGALLLTFMPMQGVLSIDIITAMLAVLPLFFIVVPQPARPAAAEGGLNTSFFQDFKEGLRYALGWPGLVMIGLMATLINGLINPAFSLLPILVTKHFNGEAFQLAWLDSAVGVGIVSGGLLLSVWGGFKRQIYTSMLGISILGVAVLTIGLAPSSMFWLALVGVFGAGIAMPIANGPLNAVVQATVAPEMQGRVFTLITSIAGLMSPLGLIAAGPLSDLLGVQTWFLVGGVVTFLMGVVASFIPAIIHFEDGHDYGRKGKVDALAPKGAAEPKSAAEPAASKAAAD